MKGNSFFSPRFLEISEVETSQASASSNVTALWLPPSAGGGEPDGPRPCHTRGAGEGAGK